MLAVTLDRPHAQKIPVLALNTWHRGVLKLLLLQEVIVSIFDSDYCHLLMLLICTLLLQLLSLCRFSGEAFPIEISCTGRSTAPHVHRIAELRGHDAAHH